MSSISFSPPLPCSSVIGDGICGKEATVATLYPTGGGQFHSSAVLQGVCGTPSAGLRCAGGFRCA